MKKSIEVKVIRQAVCCDSCGAQLYIEDDPTANLDNTIELSFKGVGYSVYGGRCDSEWTYQLCRKCASSLKDFLDGSHSLQELPQATE